MEAKEFDNMINSSLAMLKKNVDQTFLFLEECPEKYEYIVQAWSDAVKDFVSYGIKKSEERGGENLFKRIARMFIFGR